MLYVSLGVGDEDFQWQEHFTIIDDVIRNIADTEFYLIEVHVVVILLKIHRLSLGLTK